MNYVSIEKTSIANGEGVRVVLWVSGCSIHCQGCHNPETWDFGAGKIFDQSSEHELIESLKPSYIKGLTLSGGNPLEIRNFSTLQPLLAKIKREYSAKDIWCYTGYTFEELLKNEKQKELLSYIDVLVDGPFDCTKRDITLRFRGSSNQRIIDVKESLNQNNIILWR